MWVIRNDFFKVWFHELASFGSVYTTLSNFENACITKRLLSKCYKRYKVKAKKYNVDIKKVFPCFISLKWPSKAAAREDWNEEEEEKENGAGRKFRNDKRCCSYSGLSQYRKPSWRFSIQNEAQSPVGLSKAQEIYIFISNLKQGKSGDFLAAPIYLRSFPLETF